MLLINKLQLSGNLVADPIPGETKKGVSVSNYKIAVPIEKSRRAANGPTADFFNISAYGKPADVANTVFKRGMHVYIEARLENDTYVTAEGKRVTKLAIVATKNDVVDRPRRKTPEKATGQDV